MSPVAGPSHSTDENSMMMYMDQSSMSGMPGPSGYQDNSALVSTDSQPQGNYLSLPPNIPLRKDRNHFCLCSFIRASLGVFHYILNDIFICLKILALRAFIPVYFVHRQLLKLTITEYY